MKIEEVIDNNYQQNALIISLVRQPVRPVEVSVIERAAEKEEEENLQEAEEYSSLDEDEHSRQFSIGKDNSANDETKERERKREIFVN